jgi:raffinose/stachyose/melibiose transport system substrate-binding protein
MRSVARGRHLRRSTRAMLALAIVGVVAAGCSPGSDESSDPEPTPTDAPAETTAPNDSSDPGTTDGEGTESPTEPAGAPDCGTDDVVMNVYFETGFNLPFALTEEFTKQYPNVTWDIKEDQFSNLLTATPRLLSGENPPDLIRLPTMVSLATDGLLKNLDDYAEAFGWNDFPAAQLSQNRVDDSGIRGSGSLYAMGLNYSLTGVFYNRELAAQVGMTEPPKTVAEFDAFAAEAESQGLLPIMVWNASASGGGLAFPLQQLMAAYGPSTDVNEWIFQQPGATIDTPSNLEAAEHLQGWIEAGYFPEDANAIQYTDANTRFRAGEGLFLFNGDWENANYDAEMGDNVGFLLFPSIEADGPVAAMSAPLTYGIAADAPNADCAAFFFNWVATNEQARQINVDVGGSSPGGPVDLPVPPVAEGSITSETLAAGAVVAADNGQMDFIANATGAIFAEGWTPELQKMVGGQQDAAGLLSAVQAEYENQLES